MLVALRSRISAIDQSQELDRSPVNGAKTPFGRELNSAFSRIPFFDI